MKVVFYHRKPEIGCFSLEKLFSDIRASFSDEIKYNVIINRYLSRGIIRRFANALEAILYQGDINHITGDVHYLSYFLKKKKTVLTVHDCGAFEYLQGIKRTVFFYLWYWLPEKRVSLITVISESVKKELLLILKFDPKKVRVIYCCISKRYKRKPGIFDQETPAILMVGVTKNKNMYRTVDALKGISCQLNIVGNITTEQKRYLDNSRLQYEIFANLIEDEMVNMYERTDMLVFASTYEGFGLPIIEANAVGRPVVTSNVSSMPEVAGNSACLVNPYDVNSIREGILKVIKDSEYRDRLIKSGFINADRFSAKIISSQYEDLYREVLAAKGTNRFDN